MNATVRYRDFFHDMYTWVSGLCDAEKHSTLDEIHRFWADDGRIITYGRVTAVGIEALRKHFEAFPQRYDKVEIREPYYKYLESGDEVVIEYDILICARDHEVDVTTGEAARQELRVMVIFSLTDGKISEMREVAAVKAGDA
ncbi:nuclear transport factor 2 family protein [Streptomyces sp. NPDC088116]|uniref:nuclear transport factor 2 family protein n=1 Tax=Streptomyces sp. NPDC088116 TaxID=3365825 RepID=UPI0038063D08